MTVNHVEESAMVKALPPLSEIEVHPDGLINLAEALIETTKKDYIALAKARYQASHWDHHKDFSNPLNFVRRDPYGLFKNIGNGLGADDIFDAWDKLMLKSIKKGDYVKVISHNTSCPIGTVCEVIKLRTDQYYQARDGYYIIRYRTPGVKYRDIKVTIDDIELYPKLPNRKH